MNYVKSYDDFKDDLNVHLKQIIKCCHEFDNGERESMLHVTTSLRTLLKNNPPRTVSLLHHLGKSNIDIVDIAGIGKPSSIVLSPISATRLSLHDYLPNLNSDNRKWIKLDDWYDGLVLYYQDNYSFTRKSLIADFGEKYAQHSDKKVPEEMHALHKNIDDFVGWKMVAGGIRIKQANIIFSVLRMICHEVIICLQKHKLSSLDINGLYFDKLKDIKPYTPFGDFNVSLTRKEDVSIEFYCNHKGGIGKLLITGDYALVNHKENVPRHRLFLKVVMQGG